MKINTCHVSQIPENINKILKKFEIPSLYTSIFSFENNNSKEIFVDYFNDDKFYWINIYHKREYCAGVYDSYVSRGYTSPISNMSENHLKEFWRQYISYKSINGFVCELFKPHPLIPIKNIGLLEDNKIFIKRVCSIDLKKENNFFDICKSKNRNILRKSLKLGNIYKVSKDLDGFRDSYNEEMAIKNAASEYFLHSDAFISDSKDFIRIDILSNKKEILASGLFFISDYCIEYGLSYITPNGKKSGAGVHLIFSAYEEAKLNNLDTFYLGGGLTPDENDSLFKFKSSLSNVLSSYHIYPMVYNNTKYREITHGMDRSTLLCYRN